MYGMVHPTRLEYFCSIDAIISLNVHHVSQVGTLAARCDSLGPTQN